MKSAVFSLLLAAAAGLPGSEKHVDVLASFVPPSQEGASPAVAVSLVPKTPDIRVNEVPAPRIKLDPGQAILVHEPPAKTSPPLSFDPADAKYLDPNVPVRFKVELADEAPKGTHTVKATVTYFYCSKRQGWCRKGTEKVELTVKVD
jgi:hypothetical protein